MRRQANRAALLWAIVAVAVGSASPARAATRCVRGGERVLATSPRLVLLAVRDPGVRIVCRRDTRIRRTLVRLSTPCSHCVSDIRRVVLRGRFAYAVVSRRAFNDQEAELVTLDTARWRTRRVALDLPDQGDTLRSDVADLVALPQGRALVRVRNDFAAGIALAGPDAAAWLDEGLATAIGRPRVAGGRIVWRHGPSARSAATAPADRCPRAPHTGDDRILATAVAIASGSWTCVRATGATSRLDGVVVRLLGTLAVVQRPADVRVVDLRTTTTIAGPVTSDPQARSSATVGSSGTLVLRRPGACAGDAEIVAVTAGAPERRLACGDLRDLRYVDGLVRWRDQRTGTLVTAALP
jgi:hypothetical protein